MSDGETEWAFFREVGGQNYKFTMRGPHPVSRTHVASGEVETPNEEVSYCGSCTHGWVHAENRDIVRCDECSIYDSDADALEAHDKLCFCIANATLRPVGVETQVMGDHLRAVRPGDHSTPAGVFPITWDELQAAKTEAWGPDATAVEVYPPDREIVNDAPIRHLWRVETAPSLFHRTYPENVRMAKAARVFGLQLHGIDEKTSQYIRPDADSLTVTLRIRPKQLEVLISLTEMVLDEAGVTFGDWLESNPDMRMSVETTFELLDAAHHLFERIKPPGINFQPVADEEQL
jgi:hypothetical protein